MHVLPPSSSIRRLTRLERVVLAAHGRLARYVTELEDRRFPLYATRAPDGSITLPPSRRERVLLPLADALHRLGDRISDRRWRKLDA